MRTYAFFAGLVSWPAFAVFLFRAVGMGILLSASGLLLEEMSLDGVVVLGDITHFGPPSWASEFLSQLIRPAYAVPGNCDTLGTHQYIEDAATSLHRRKVKLE